MSVLNCFVTPDTAHVFTDGGFWNSTTMTLQGFGNKVIALPNYNAVIASTGPEFISPLLGSRIADGHQFDDFDDLANNFSSFVIAAKDFVRPIIPLAWGAFELILAGWSESKNEPCAYHLRGYKDGGWPAFHVREVTRFASPSDIRNRDFEFDANNPGDSGLSLVRMQREAKHSLILKDGQTSDAQYSVVAGFCQHSIVSRDGIAMRVLEQWPDKIGEVASA